MSARLKDVVFSGGLPAHDMRSERVRVVQTSAHDDDDKLQVRENHDPPSYIRITAGDKKVLMYKDTCTTIIHNNHDCVKTVYPTLSMAYYNLVQLCQGST